MEPKEEFWIIFKQISKAPKEFKDEGNILTNLIGGEKYPRKLRNAVREMVYFLEEYPEFTNLIPDNFRQYFEGYTLFN